MNVVLYVWYPNPLSKAIGVQSVINIMIGVDICIGPILGLIIYNENKKSLKFDLTIIILIQVLALIYGVLSISKVRPAWIVFHGECFELIKKNDVIESNLDNVPEMFKEISFLGPQYVAVKVAQDIDQKNKDIFTETMGHISIAQMPERYQPLANMKYELKRHSQALSLLKQFNPKHNVENILEKYPDANAWLPLKASAVDMVVLINKEKAEVVKIVDLRPWN